MPLLYYSPQFLEHETGQHPEHAGRLRTIVAGLQGAGLWEKCRQPDWQPAATETMSLVHEGAYLAEAARFAAAGGGRIEVDTVVSRRSFDAAALAAGAACNAVERVVAGESSTALCLVRPPGHHALPTGAMGFCLVNNVAVAARMAIRKLSLDRVLIVDWDVHHGNGTQDAFWTDEQVGFFSIHRWPFYPGTGSASETGSLAGLGATANLPIEFGTSRDRYLSLFARELDAFAARLKPQLVILSAGFDAHREDPIGSLGLESEDFQSLTATVLDVAATHAGGRLVSVLEGGYNTQRLAESVVIHLSELVDREREVAAQAEK